MEREQAAESWVQAQKRHHGIMGASIECLFFPI